MKVSWLCIGLVVIALFVVNASPLPNRAERSCAFTSHKSGSDVIEGVGFNIDFIEPRAEELRMLAQSGVRWVRTDLKWDATETQRGVFDFSSYDRLGKALEDAGLRIVFILDYGNPLYDSGAPPRSEAARSAFVRWSVAAASHFAGRGIVWEVYNEPNHPQFWPPRANVDEYIALALAVGRAFEASLPRERLIGPATSGIDFQFLEACFKAGMLKYWSAVSVHPYRREAPETVADDYCRLRGLISQYAPQVGAGKKDVAIFAGEWGYSAAWQNLDNGKQAELLVRSWLVNVANGIGLSIWYDWHNDGPDRSETEHNFGVVSHRYHENRVQPYDPKPAYSAVKTFTSVLAGYEFDQRLSVGLADDYVFLFRKDKATVIVVWTTVSAHQVQLPVITGQFKSVNVTGESLGIVSGSVDGLKMTITSAPMYLTLMDRNWK